MRRPHPTRSIRTVPLARAICTGCLIAAFVLGMGACASGPPRHQAVMTSGTLQEAIGALQDTVDAMRVPLAGSTTAALTPEQYHQANDAVLKLLKEGRHFNSLIAAWPVGAPAPQAVIDSSDEITRLLGSTLDLIPLDHREVVTARALAIEQAVITVLALRQ